MSADDLLRQQLTAFLHEGHAHATIEQVLDGFPRDRAGVRPPGMSHSGWELLEHMRIAQNDILRFSQSADYVSPKFPEGYWPSTPAPGGKKDWDQAVRSFYQDRTEFEAMIRDPQQDLNRPFPWGDGQTLLREALLIIDHNAYHLGQLLLVRSALGEWPG